MFKKSFVLKRNALDGGSYYCTVSICIIFFGLGTQNYITNIKIKPFII